MNTNPGLAVSQQGNTYPLQYVLVLASFAASMPYQGPGIGLIDENGAQYAWNGSAYAIGGGGGGATTYAALTDKASVNLPTVNTPLASALTLLAPRASPSFSGVATFAGASTATISPMGALVIDVSLDPNSKTINVDTPMTFSSTPPAGRQFSLICNNSGGSGVNLTIPSSFSLSLQTAVTALAIPAGGWVYLTWLYTGSVYLLGGDA